MMEHGIWGQGIIRRFRGSCSIDASMRVSSSRALTTAKDALTGVKMPDEYRIGWHRLYLYHRCLSLDGHFMALNILPHIVVHTIYSAPFTASPAR